MNVAPNAEFIFTGEEDELVAFISESVSLLFTISMRTRSEKRFSRKPF